MDDKMFECSVCLQVCRKCINCLQCNQILCRRHVRDLPHNRCPVCRDSPFRFQENIALQRIIAELNRQRGLPEEPPESEEEEGEEVAAAPAPATPEGRGGDPVALATSLIQRRWREAALDRVATQGPPRERQAGGAEAAVVPATAFGAALGEGAAAAVPNGAAGLPPAVAPAAAVIQRRWREAAAARAAAEAAEVHTGFGSKVACTGREGEFMKLPSDEHAANMRAHVRSCSHGDCRHVWSGPWGSFIGGAEGRMRFDLTDCLEGKQLNQMIGWNYADPRS